ncbi:MAG: hypothetical protein U1A72_16880 [Sulfuritalea sp.]|nr:hypothetical protein [Sulfuritalea sp.]
MSERDLSTLGNDNRADQARPANGQWGLPRGIRNHNPGNLKELAGDNTRWQGERATDDDPVFEEFDSPTMGIRALALTLINYTLLHDLHTVAEVIARWAPPSENDSGAYLASVCRRCEYEPGQWVDLDMEFAPLLLLTEAIIHHENGKPPADWPQATWYPLATLVKGVERATLQHA